jgi:hypothetical protein
VTICGTNYSANGGELRVNISWGGSIEPAYGNDDLSVNQQIFDEKSIIASQILVFDPTSHLEQHN